MSNAADRALSVWTRRLCGFFGPLLFAIGAATPLMAYRHTIYPYLFFGGMLLVAVGLVLERKALDDE